MPRNKVSNDIDHVRKDPQPEKAPKGLPPQPQPLPQYKPLQITMPLTYGHGLLSDTIAFDDPYTIFSLFFINATLELLVQHINKYAFLYYRSKSGSACPWYPTIINKFRAFLRVSI